MNSLAFWRSLKADLVAHIAPDQRPQSRWRWVGLSLLVMIKSPGFHLSLIYRLAHKARTQGGWPGRFVAWFLRWFMRHWHHCDISPTAKLQGGVIFPHPQGIVIGPDVQVGANSYIFHNVTLGGSPHRQGAPIIGQNARIYPGAVIAGPVQIGDSVWISANSVVSRDVPANSLIRPPKMITTAFEPESFDSQRTNSPCSDFLEQAQAPSPPAMESRDGKCSESAVSEHLD